jgi:broad specificity phosphatase PhoE|tara:strand:- start:230 stop:865 length:636 start_codon:yes stop_codon:yes gene_type:complete
MPLFLIRHGESEGNALRVVQGQGGDYALTVVGKGQAQSVGKLLATLPVISFFCSPLRRARETAELIVDSLAESISEASLNNSITFDKRLMEYDFGDLTGTPFKDLPEDYMDFWRDIRPEPLGSEGSNKFRERVNAAITKYLKIVREADPSSICVAVTHGGVIDAICSSVVGLPAEKFGVFRTNNCAITELDEVRGQIVITRHNDSCHLKGE